MIALTIRLALLSSVLIGAGGCVASKESTPESRVITYSKARLPTDGEKITAPELVETQGNESAPSGEGTPLSIDEAIILEANANPTVRRMGRYQLMAELRSESVEAQLWPRLDISASASHAERYYNFSSPDYAYREFSRSAQTGPSAYVNMPLDVFGQLHNQIKQAKLSEEDSVTATREARADGAANVRAAYLQALKVQSGQDADKAFLADLADVAEGMNGDVKKTLELRMTAVRTSIEKAQSVVDAAVMGVKVLAGLPLQKPVELTSRLSREVKPIDVESFVQRALAMKPNVKSADLRMKQAALSVQQQKDSRKPTVNVFGFYSQSYSGDTPIKIGDTKYAVGTVMLNVNVPIFSWDHGATAANDEVVKIAEDQAKEDFATTKSVAEGQIRGIVQPLVALEPKLAVLQDEKIARDAYEAALHELQALPPDRRSADAISRLVNLHAKYRKVYDKSVEALVEYYLAQNEVKRMIGEI